MLRHNVPVRRDLDQIAANYGFDWKDQNGNDKSDFYRADLNYKF